MPLTLRFRRKSRSTTCCTRGAASWPAPWKRWRRDAGSTPGVEFVGSFLTKTSTPVPGGRVIARCSASRGHCRRVVLPGAVCRAPAGIEQRTKEIGIRKVLGAVWRHRRQPFQNFLKLAAVALLISLRWPGCHAPWLENYPSGLSEPWAVSREGLRRADGAGNVSFPEHQSRPGQPVKSLRSE
jgi:hypothetical protein